MINLEIDPREFRRNLTEYDRKIMPEYRKALKLWKSILPR